MKKIIILIFFLMIQCLAATVLAGDKITLATLKWQPYVGQSLTDYGFAAELVSTALNRSGYEVKFEFMPWARAMLSSEKGRYDGAFPAYYSKERDQKFSFTDKFAQSPVVFCTRADSDIQYNGDLRSLKDYLIGVIRGFVNTPEFDQATYLQKDETPSDLQNLKKLLNKRVDIIIIDKFVAISLLKNNPYFQGDIRSVKFLDPPLETKPMHVIFSYQASDYKQKVSAFNKGLKEIKKDGTFEEILEKHGVR